MEYEKIFGERIKKLREEKGLSMRQLASELGISHGALSQYENAKRVPDIYLAKKMAEFFNTNCDYLIGLNDNRYNDK